MSVEAADHRGTSTSSSRRSCTTRWWARSCNPEEVWQMVDEMVVAQAKWLPQYAHAVPAPASG
jgi:hypothetical protein